jgi:hypothetical protein
MEITANGDNWVNKLKVAMDSQEQATPQKKACLLSLAPQKISSGFIITTSETGLISEQDPQGKVISIFHITVSLIPADKWFKSCFSWLKVLDLDKTVTLPLIEVRCFMIGLQNAQHSSGPLTLVDKQTLPSKAQSLAVEAKQAASPSEGPLTQVDCGGKEQAHITPNPTKCQQTRPRRSLRLMTRGM